MVLYRTIEKKIGLLTFIIGIGIIATYILLFLLKLGVPWWPLYYMATFGFVVAILGDSGHFENIPGVTALLRKISIKGLNILIIILFIIIAILLVYKTYFV